MYLITPPPSSSTSINMCVALSYISSVKLSIMYNNLHGSATSIITVSSLNTSCVLRATLADRGVGNPTASSNELVWRDCTPPMTADIASTVVHTTLLDG